MNINFSGWSAPFVEQTIANNATITQARMSHSHSHDHYDGEEPHDHSHDHGAHDHDEDITPALQNLLYEHIDFSKVTCLNEEEPRSAAKVLQKTWIERMENSPELRSDADEQLLLTVP